MKTVQMTLDDHLLSSVDKAVKKLKTTRSAFTRDALKDALIRLNVSKLELRHKKGYKLHPVKNEEFTIWEKEQDWGHK